RRQGHQLDGFEFDPGGADSRTGRVPDGRRSAQVRHQPLGTNARRAEPGAGRWLHSLHQRHHRSDDDDPGFDHAQCPAHGGRGAERKFMSGTSIRRRSAILLTGAGMLAAKAPALKVGIAETSITPTWPMELWGYGNRISPSTGVLDDIYAKAILFE